MSGTALQRFRAGLRDPGRSQAKFDAMRPTAEELDWWRSERRRHRWKHALRVGVPWAVATCAGVLFRDHGWRHLEPWIHGIFVGVVGGTFMSVFTWSSHEKTVKLRELRGRRLREVLLNPPVPEDEPRRLIQAVPVEVSPDR